MSIATSSAVHLTKLPQGVQKLDLSSNHFTGTPNLTHLPQEMQVLGIVYNQFTGTPNLSRLPQGMKSMYSLLLQGNSGICGTGALGNASYCSVPIIWFPQQCSCTATSFNCVVLNTKQKTFMIIILFLVTNGQ